MQVIDAANTAHKFAGEFGVTALLLVVVLGFIGFATWRISNRVVDAIAGSMARIAAATEVSSQNVVELRHAVDQMSARMDRIEHSLRIGEQQRKTGNK